MKHTATSNWALVGLAGLALACEASGTNGATPRGPTRDGGSFAGVRDGGASLLPPADFGPFTASDPAPKPISGGTLTIDDARGLAAVGDSDRDVVHLVDLELESVVATVALERGDEPGRALFGPNGDLYVVLRTGAVVAIDVVEGAVRWRRDVCPSPRGIAYDETDDALLVACLGGSLLSLAPDDARAPTSRFVADDLRDVVVEGGRVWVSTFRSAEVRLLRGEGAPRTVRIDTLRKGRDTLEPGVAWRMVADPEGGVYVLHQYATTRIVPIDRPEAYGGGEAGRPVECGVTHVRHDGAVRGSWSTGLTLAVDLAVAPDRSFVAFAQAGAHTHQTSAPVLAFEPGDLETNVVGTSDRPFGGQAQVVSVALRESGEVVAFSREPPALYVDRRSIPLTGASVAHTGHTMFHRSTFAFIACASCHPEAHDDGRVWRFEGLGPRRTQSSRGLAGTEPFHWDGDMRDLQQLLGEVMSQRMSAGPLDPQHVDLLGRWLETLEPLEVERRAETVAVTRGRALFDEVGCGGCHAGPALTNNSTVDVGTGGEFQVPSLRGLASRAPYMHDGCAATLHERFRPDCGGGDSHGATSALSASQIDDLVAYLRTL